MTQRRRLTAAALVLGLAFVAARASAAIDFSGSWNVQVTGGLLDPYTSHWLVAQTGSQLSVVADGGSPAGGFIDPTLGGFTVNFPGGGDGCSGAVARGTVSGDGMTFTGTLTTFFLKITPPTGCFSFDSDLSGTRATCGNGVHDPGEECDDGNTVGGDCCSATCRLEPAGVACGGVPPCGDKSCDGAGACQDVPATVCGDTCMPGTCTAGSCVQAPAPPGTPCDLDANLCTQDACDTGGHCRSRGLPVFCPLCQVCTPTSGCADGPALACDQPPRENLKLQAGAAAHRSVSFGWSTPALLAFFGNPLTSTDYALCAFDVSTPTPSLLLRAVAPAGGTCGTKPCWKAGKSGSFSYKDPERTPDGLSAVTLATGAHGTSIKMKGKGANLGLPPSFDGVSDVIVQVQNDEYSFCYGARYDGVKLNADATKLTGHKTVK
jgi:cysteine-rich repeat protein